MSRNTMFHKPLTLLTLGLLIVVGSAAVAKTIEPGPSPYAEAYVRTDVQEDWAISVQACVGQTVYFDALGDGAPDCTDGIPETECDCRDFWSRDVDIEKDPKQICDSIDFLWTYEDDGQTITLSGRSAFSYAFSEPGTYTVKLKVTDDSGSNNDGADAEDTVTVAVSPNEFLWQTTPTEFTLAITAPQAGAYCKPGETLSCAANGEDTDSWQKCDGTSGTSPDVIIGWEWTATEGSISGNGASAIYTPPSEFEEGEEVTITVSAEDEGQMGQTDAGSRKDGRKSATVVIKLTNKAREWAPEPTPISASIVRPSAGYEARPEEQVVCKATASDSDHWTFTEGGGSGDAADEIVRYEWSASAGSFSGTGVGQEVIWICPPAEQVTDGQLVELSVRVMDKGEVPPGDIGSRDDADATATTTLTVEKDKTRVWDPGDKLWAVIQAPSHGGYVCPGMAFQCVADGDDLDHWRYTDGSGEGDAPDEVIYNWSVTVGWLSAPQGRSTVWNLPEGVAGSGTIRLDADDVGAIPPEDTGTRNDTPVTDTATVTILDPRIIEPDGVPPTDNHFKFDTVAHPNGSCQVTALGTSGFTPAEDQNLRWTLGSIAGSTLTPLIAEGPNPTFTYTTLPPANASFGVKILRLGHIRAPCFKTCPVEIFFDGVDGGTNHPAPGSGTSPNWFYYWRQTGAGHGAPEFDASYFGSGQTRFSAGAWRSYIGWRGNDTSTAWQGAQGIDFFANVCRHEEQHRLDMTALWGNNDRSPGNDPDADYLPTVGLGGVTENSLGIPYHAGGYNPNNAASVPDHFQYGPGFMDCEDYAMHRQPGWLTGSADAEDWSCPGHQWP